MHSEKLGRTYTSGSPPREGDVGSRQKNAFLRKRLSPERRKGIHMPESIILRSETAHTQPAGENKWDVLQNDPRRRFFSRHQAGRLCR